MATWTKATRIHKLQCRIAELRREEASLQAEIAELLQDPQAAKEFERMRQKHPAFRGSLEIPVLR